MLKLFNYLILLLLSLLLSGCLFGKKGYIHNRKNTYLTSKSLPKLKLPANLHSAKMQPTYPIPDGVVKQRAAAPLLPPGNNWQLTSTQQTKLNTTAMQIRQDSKGVNVLSIPADYLVMWHTMLRVLPQADYEIIGSDMKTGVIEVRVPTRQEQTARIYQFNILQGSTTILVKVLDQTGQVISGNISKSMLHSLYRQLKKDNA